MFRKLVTLLTVPWIWLAALVIWAVTLFLLSSTSKTMPEGGLEIPHIDKVLHFGYFMGGGFMFSAWQLLKNRTGIPFALRFLIPALIFAVIGALDEYHQTFTPGRSGNDPFDWLADLLGAITGMIIANRIHPLFLKFSSRSTQILEN